MIDIKTVRSFFRNYDKNIEYVEKIEGKMTLKEATTGYMKKEAKKLEDAKKEIIIRDLLYLQLSLNEKYIIDLIFVEKKKVSEAADMLYISEETFFRRQRKIYLKLAKYLDEFKELLK